MLEKFRDAITAFKSGIPTVTETPPDTMLNESAWYHDSDMFRLLGGLDRFNPDELVQRKGNQIYRKMMRDPQVKAAYDLRVNIIISRGWRFNVVNDDQQEMADFFEEMITNHFVGTWIQAMRSILLSKAHGFSITEKIFDSVEINKKVAWVIRALKPKPYHTFEFDTDNFGNVKKIIQNIEGSDKVIKREKVVLMINHPELDPIWGESDLRSVYRPYWEKDVTLKFKNIYIERLAGGFIVATATEKAPSLSPVELSNFQSVLSRIQQMTAIRAPQGYEVEVKHGPDTRAFEESVAFNDGQILRGLLIPNLIGFSDLKNGSRALGDTQLDAFMMTVQEEGEYLADTLNEQVFAQIAWWNFGRKDFPRFMLDGYTTTQKRKIAETWTDAVKNGVVVNTFKDENRTRNLLLYPPIDEDEREGEKPDKKDNPGEEPKEPVNSPEKEPTEKPEVRLSERQKEIDAKGYRTLDEMKELDPKGAAEGKYKTWDEGVLNSLGFSDEQTFVDRVDFADIKNKLNTNEDQFAKEMSGPVDSMSKELVAKLRDIVAGLPKDKGKIKTDKEVGKLTTAISSKSKSDFKKIVIKNLRKNYDLGRGEAEKLVKKSVKGDKDLLNKLDIKFKFSAAWKMCCTDPDWSAKHFVEGLLLEAATAFFEGDAFKKTADITETMLAAAQQALLDGITNEASITEIVKDFQEAIPTLIGTPSADGTISPKANKARLETIARTSITNIFSQAQLALYNDPALGDFVQGMEYSAILDSVITPICSSLDGKKYMKNDPIWGSITPPNHFNCRSVLIPITLVDEWNPSNKKGITEPNKGFGQSRFEKTLDKEGKEPKGKPRTVDPDKL